MPSINLTDDELAAVSAAVRRAIEDDRFPHAADPSAAAHLRAHVQHALEVGGHVLQDHALISADPSELRLAAGRADAGRFMHDGLKRQIGRASCRERVFAVV